MVRTAMAIERERDRGCMKHLRYEELVTRGKRASLLLVWERSRRLLVHEGFRDRAKVRPGFLPSQDR